MIIRAYLFVLIIVLTGYAVFGRGFAHTGGGPLFLSELLLVSGLALTLASGQILAILRSPIVWALILFVAWSAARTLPYLGVYGIDAFRDAVVWGYAAFTIIVSCLLLRDDNLFRAFKFYARCIPWIIVLGTVGFFIGKRYNTEWISALFHLGNGVLVSFIQPKAADVAVHLAGVAVFAALGLRKYFLGADKIVWWRESLWWVVWVLGFLQSASAQRGGMLAALLALILMTLFQPQRRLVKFGALVILFFAVLVMLDVKIPTGHGDRMISPVQLVDNIRSLYTKTEQKELDQTSSDRVDWWKEIYRYTVEGPYFWTGKGYGVLLALVDHGGDWGLHLKPVSRSPHNAHINILARSGVPGLMLWLSVIIITAWTALHGTIRNLYRGDVVLARVYLFLACYGAAALVNMTFDVFLEGPQGGIWFWSLVGAVIATREAERRMERSRREATDRVTAMPINTTHPAYY